MKYLLSLSFAVVAILFLVSNLIFGWPLVMWYNDYLLARYLHSLETIDFPHNSKVVSSSSLFGILHGVSNHCDSSIAVLLESDMAITQFENFAQELVLLDPPFSQLGSRYSEI
ncbi:MAG: hypothetical protein AAF518_28960, partial [Spirochaetota bacterium]